VTPTLFDLPLRLGDAAALAAILLSQPQNRAAALKPIADEFRSRAAARASGTVFEAMTPLFPSLERDPVHPSALYICVDGVEQQPLLLRIAPSSTPSSGLFPKAILIGRTFVGDQEVVLNAIPFGPLDHDRIAVWAEQVNPAFQPKPFGNRASTVLKSEDPEATFQAAFAALRKILRASGRNSAAFGLLEGQDPDQFCFTTVWAAIRCGWREGYALQSRTSVPPIAGFRRRPFEMENPESRTLLLTKEMGADEIEALLS